MKYLGKIALTFMGKQFVKWFTPFYCFFRGDSVWETKCFILEHVGSLFIYLPQHMLSYCSFWSYFTGFLLWLLYKDQKYWSNFFWILSIRWCVKITFSSLESFYFITEKLIISSVKYKEKETRSVIFLNSANRRT